MCGLIGIASNGQTKLSPELVPFMFNHLMQANDMRGGDSYGFMFIDPTKKGPTSYKVIGTHQDTARGDKLWRRGIRRIRTALKNNDPFIVIGHNRHATTGKVSLRNQHPFQMGKMHSDRWIIGAHNGMLSRHEKIAKELNIKNHYEVDSEVIFRAILKQPDTPLDVIGELDPVCIMALVYMMGDSSKLHLYRGSNPLSVAAFDGLLFWNSENKPLQSLVSCLDVDAEVIGKDTHRTFDLTTGKLGDSTKVKSTFNLNNAIRETTMYNGGQRYLHGSHDPYDDWYNKPTSARYSGPIHAPSIRSTKDITSYGKHATKSLAEQERERKIEMYTSIFDIDVGQERELLSITELHSKEHGELDSCVVCGLAHPITGIQACAGAETLLHYDGQAFCGTCYFFTVQQAAEERIMIMRKSDAKDTAK